MQAGAMCKNIKLVKNTLKFFTNKMQSANLNLNLKQKIISVEFGVEVLGREQIFEQPLLVY